MAVFNGAFPVLPGREDPARAFAQAISGPNKAEFAAMQDVSGVDMATPDYSPPPDLVLDWTA